MSPGDCNILVDGFMCVVMALCESATFTMQAWSIGCNWVGVRLHSEPVLPVAGSLRK